MTNMTKLIADDWKQHDYYEHAEKSLSPFWDKDSIFYKHFNSLDLSNVVELACGHGRHVPQYINEAGAISLVDVNNENIDFCKNRFKDYTNKITFFVNQGSDFSGIEDNSKTAIFSYDAMVHFDMLAIGEYLKESYRILAPNGKCLFHHSNYSKSPLNFYQHNPHWRNFMSGDIFANLATIAGLKIISQDIIGWGVGEKRYFNLDCVTLLQKL